MEDFNMSDFDKKQAERGIRAMAELEELIPQMESFDLLGNIFLLNHMYEVGNYQDARDGLFVAADIIALTALNVNTRQSDPLSPEQCDPLRNSFQ